MNDMIDESEQNACIYIAAIGTLAVYCAYIETTGHGLLAGCIAGAAGIIVLFAIYALIRRLQS